MRAAEGVYALRYAYRTASLKGEHFYGHPTDCREPCPIDYFAWVAISDGRVDTGFTPLFPDPSVKEHQHEQT
jgi:hypothetical protein